MFNQTIADYIKTQKNAGFDDEAIKKALVGSGWAEADVDATFRKISSPGITKKGQTAGGYIEPLTQEPSPGATQIKPNEDSSQIASDQNSTEGAFSSSDESNSSPGMTVGGTNINPSVGTGGPGTPWSNESSVEQFQDYPEYVSNPLSVLKIAFKQPGKVWVKAVLLSILSAVLIPLSYVIGFFALYYFAFNDIFAENLILVFLFICVGALIFTFLFSLLSVGFSRISLRSLSNKTDIRFSFMDTVRAAWGLCVVTLVAWLLLVGVTFIVGALDAVGGAMGAILGVLIAIVLTVFILVRLIRMYALLPYHQLYEKTPLFQSLRKMRELGKGHILEILGFLSVLSIVTAAFMIIVSIFGSSAVSFIDGVDSAGLAIVMLISFLPTALTFSLGSFGNAYRYLSLRQLEAGQVEAVKTHSLNIVMIIVAIVISIGASVASATFTTNSYEDQSWMNYGSEESSIYNEVGGGAAGISRIDAERRTEASGLASTLIMYSANNKQKVPLTLDPIYNNPDYSYSFDDSHRQYMVYTPLDSDGNECFEADKCYDFELSVILSDGEMAEIQ